MTTSIINAPHDWLEERMPEGWASCAISENGFVRIISQPRYPSPISTTEAIDLLAVACDNDLHEFWNCDVSLFDARIVDRTRLHGPRQVTDAYLVALSVQNDGCFVTFDRSLSLTAVRGAADEHLAVV